MAESLGQNLLVVVGRLDCGNYKVVGSTGTFREHEPYAVICLQSRTLTPPGDTAGDSCRVTYCKWLSIKFCSSTSL